MDEQPETPDKTCPDCGSTDLENTGVGTTTLCSPVAVKNPETGKWSMRDFNTWRNWFLCRDCGGQFELVVK